ncbi:MAG: DUF805 domain-containing protein [Succinivibrio dextrinosolvens]|nr:DUF805 domain-containing protein [Succinivibrio dextrinosolvens]
MLSKETQNTKDLTHYKKGFTMSEQIITAKPVKKKTMSRTTYSVFTVLFIVTFILLGAVVKAGDEIAAAASEPGIQTVCKMLHFLPLITVILYSYFCMARRLRDCGKSSYYALFILIPFFGIVYVIYLCFPERKVTVQN